MAICPDCHSPDKNFFAPRCHNCNAEITMWEQIGVSLIFFTVKALGGLFVLWFLFVWLPG